MGASLKEQAAEAAVAYVRSGMRLGLGSGSTATCFTNALSARYAAGALRDLLCVPTSRQTESLARTLGLPLVSLEGLLEDHGSAILDLAFDGADEVDPDLNLIKGLGKAALREKMVEMHARKFVVMVDESKLVSRLGRGPLPVEIVPFAARVTISWLGSLGCRAELWTDETGQPYLTDNGNWLVRCWFPDGIHDAHALNQQLNERPGVVEHGLFLNMTSEVIVAGESGIRILKHD
jgi:ribose 5-phosphate isomerase A